MKKILNGKLYDTQSAKLICDNWNGYGSGDFRYENEELYQKKNGEFFLYGEGGPLSSYSISYGGNSCYGERIIPMTNDEAIQWAQNNMDVDKYIEIFGEIEE